METKYPFHKVKHEVKTIQELLDWSGYTYASNDAYRFFEGNTICAKTYKELLQDVQFAGRYLKKILHRLVILPSLGRLAINGLLLG